MKPTLAALASLLFAGTALAHPTVAQAEREHNVRVTGAITGGVLGLAASGVVLLGSEPETGDGMFLPGATAGGVAATSTVGVLMFTGTGVVAGWLFTELFIAWDVGPWLGIPVGAGAGLVIGGLACGLSFASMMSVGIGTGSVSSGIENPFAVFGMGILAGALFGGMASTAVGAVAGPVTGFALDDDQE
jgi:hypothetical protein